MSDDDELQSLLKRLSAIGVDSTNRIEVLIDILTEIETTRGTSHSDFWRAFGVGWSCCDNTAFALPDLVRLMRNNGTAAEVLTGEDAAFYQVLPERFTIYRGSDRDFVTGISWTTDEAIARQFAEGHRGIRVTDPVLVSAEIDKSEVRTVLTERQESEIIWIPEPQRIRIETLETTV